MYEMFLKTMVETQDSVVPLVSAFHNVFSFGEIFPHGISDEQLEKLFVHLDGIIEIVELSES
jgi:hypothetical protein